MRAKSPVFILAAVVACAASGCFAVTNLGRFHEESSDAGDDAGDTSSAGAPTVGSDCRPTPMVNGAKNPFLDLDFTFLNGTAHEGRFFEYRVVDDVANAFQFRGFVDTIPTADPDIHLCAQEVVPVATTSNGDAYRLDFWAELTSVSHDYVGLADDQDHSWRIDPLHTDGTSYKDPNVTELSTSGVVQITYDHSTDFVDISHYGDAGAPIGIGATAGNAIVHLVHMDAFVGREVEVRISVVGQGNTVGLYRFSALPAAAEDALVPAVVLPDTDYRVTVYIDVNGNGFYETPNAAAGAAADEGWVLPTQTSSPLSPGIEATFDPTALGPGAADVGPP